MLVPYKTPFAEPCPNLPWAITVYGALYKDTLNPVTMLVHDQAVSAAHTAYARYGATYVNHNVHRIIDHIAGLLRLSIRRCPESSDTEAIAFPNNELVLAVNGI